MRLETKYDTKNTRRLRLSHQQIKNKTKKQANKQIKQTINSIYYISDIRCSLKSFLKFPKLFVALIASGTSFHTDGPM